MSFLSIGTASASNFTAQLMIPCWKHTWTLMECDTVLLVRYEYLRPLASESPT